MADKDVWLTAFTDGLESLFATHPTLSLLSDSDNITSFVVKEPNSLSDHSPIITWLKVNRHLDNDSSNEAIINDSLTPLPKQFFGKTIRHKNLELHYSLKTFKE